MAGVDQEAQQSNIVRLLHCQRHWDVNEQEIVRQRGESSVIMPGAIVRSKKDYGKVLMSNGDTTIHAEYCNYPA